MLLVQHYGHWSLEQKGFVSIRLFSCSYLPSPVRTNRTGDKQPYKQNRLIFSLFNQQLLYQQLKSEIRCKKSHNNNKLLAQRNVLQQFETKKIKQKQK